MLSPMILGDRAAKAKKVAALNKAVIVVIYYDNTSGFFFYHKSKTYSSFHRDTLIETAKELGYTHWRGVGGAAQVSFPPLNPPPKHQKVDC